LVVVNLGDPVAEEKGPLRLQDGIELLQFAGSCLVRVISAEDAMVILKDLNCIT